MGFARNVGVGIKDFVSVPAKGIFQVRQNCMFHVVANWLLTVILSTDVIHGGILVSDSNSQCIFCIVKDLALILVLVSRRVWDSFYEDL